MSAANQHVAVTSHARLRWLERVDPEEEYPAGAVRRAADRGVEFDLSGLVGVADEATRTVLVCHRDERETTVVTVLDDAIRRVDGGEGVKA